MSAQEFTQIGRGDGYYVHIDEDGNAISVAANGVGPNGGWIGLSIARMSLPDKNKTRAQINDAARMFAAAPEMFEALQEFRSSLYVNDYGEWQLRDGFEVTAVDAALSKARPSLTGGPSE